MDVFRIGDKLDLSPSFSYRVVVRNSDYNTYNLVSLGTGEVTTNGDAEHIIAYLNGDNNLKHEFEYHCNLVDLIQNKNLLAGFNKNFARIVI